MAEEGKPEEYSFPLSSIPPLQRHNFAQESLGALVYHMQQTGFHQWGFVIYRCAYGNDALWERFLAYMEKAVIESLDYSGRKELLKQYIQWTIMENAETMSAASKSDIRKCFTEWAFDRSEERDRRGAEHPLSHKLPRFAYCLYVDQRCLDSLKECEDSLAAKQPGVEPPVVVIVIDTEFNEAKARKGREPEIDGFKARFLGWMYMDHGSLPGLYNSLHGSPLDGMEYKRPPKVYPCLNFTLN
jgi:hypothetical protein